MPNLPFLPGCTGDRTLGQTQFHKSQALVKRNGVTIVDQSKPGIGGTTVLGQTATDPRRLKTARAGEDGMPSWHAFHNKVLRFNAYFQEAVVESNREQYRVRECTILFYLEDDSIQINEKVTANSGMPQGTLVRRGRATKSGELVGTFDEAVEPDAFFGAGDFNVGDEVTIYGRTFKITDCDAFTRSYLGSVGIDVGEPSPVPRDPHTERLEAEASHIKAGRPCARDDSLGRFLKHDRQVLRFYCVWDDTESVFGDKRYMVLLYYLSDGTIEIKEVLPPNSGRDCVGSFVGRCKLPKDVKALSKFPGANAKQVVLNTLGAAVGKNRLIMDSTRVNDPRDDVYTEADLQIGNKILVLARLMLICDCDGFTKEYYKAKYGVEDFTPIELSEPEEAAAPREVPPPTGFGTDEDSMVSVEKLVLSPPKRVAGRHMPKDASADDGSLTLRFLAGFDAGDGVSAGREFIVSYFLEDDTVSVYEMQKHNSGISPGMFLQRGKYKVPDGSRVIDLDDFSVGGKIVINGYSFVFKDADEYAKKMLARLGKA